MAHIEGREGGGGKGEARGKEIHSPALPRDPVARPCQGVSFRGLELTDVAERNKKIAKALALFFLFVLLAVIILSPTRTTGFNSVSFGRLR